MVDVDESQLSPGKLLLQGRLQAGLTQEQIAKELYMTVAKVKALESDDYGHLSSDTFARGYIRAYANLLKLDIVKVLAAYEREMQNSHEAAGSGGSAHAVDNRYSKDAKAVKSIKGTWQFLGFLGIFFAGLWLISVWFFDNHVDDEYVIPARDISSLAASVDNLPVTTTQSNTSSNQLTAVPDITQIEASVLAKLSIEKSVVDGSPGVSSVAVSSAAAGASGPVNINSVSKSSIDKDPNASFDQGSSGVTTNVAQENDVKIINSENSEEIKTNSTAKKGELDEITFSFRGESWLEVSDSRGDVLATELQASGSKLKLLGKSPFDVKLGNAPAVDIELNGRKVDVIPLLGSNVLMLKVGSSSGH
ncbi:MAG: helix-turn-helix domain-containing protein [Moraxellaceae bacterium]|nr:MAG: helix-turn-helix domain-containing protein [Moraxellaceae bacterium]